MPMLGTQGLGYPCFIIVKEVPPALAYELLDGWIWSKPENRLTVCL